MKKGRYGWPVLLPADAGKFYGKRIGLKITPLLLGKKGEPPLTARETRLIEQILEHLPKIIRKAEKDGQLTPGRLRPAIP